MPPFLSRLPRCLQGRLYRSCPGGTDVQYSRTGPSYHALYDLGGPRSRLPVLAARTDAFRGRSVMRFVRNDQHDVLFHWLSLPELAQPSTRGPTHAHRGNVFARLFDAIMASRQRQANREIERYLAARHQFSISNDRSPDHQMTRAQT